VTSRLFIGNLAEDVTEEDLRVLFSSHGNVVEVEVIRDRDREKSRGFGFVQFQTDEQGQAAIEKLHGTEFHTRRMRVKAAEPKKVGAFTIPNTSPGFAVPPATGPDHPPMTPPPATPMPVHPPHTPAPFTPPPATPALSVATPIPAVAPPRRPWIPLVAVLALLAVAGGGVAAWRLRRPPPDIHTLMILPMDVYGQAQGAEYVGYAFAQAVAVNLATVHEVRVLPVPRASEVAGASSQARSQAALDVGAGRVVMGSLTRRRDGVHLSITLVDATQNRIMWGTQREAKNADDQTLATSLAREVAGQLGARLPVLHDHILNLKGGPEMAASSELTEALGALRRGEVGPSLAATRVLVDRFPQDPAALALRTHALMLQWDAARSPATLKPFLEGLEALEKTGKGPPYSDFYRAFMLFESGQDAQAVAGFTRILDNQELSPSARAWVLRYRAVGRQRLGDLKRAMEELAESLQLDPTNAWTLTIMSEVLLQANDLEQALTRARQGVALAPNYWRTRQMLGQVLSQMGRLEEASQEFAQECELAETQLACARWAIELQKAGKKADAAQAATAASGMMDSSVGMYNLACYQALKGDKAAALAALKKSVELGCAEPGIAQDSDLASLKGDPVFEGLVTQVLARLKPQAPH
jgi:tetratricopeptide (TPR) repeat protein